MLEVTISVSNSGGMLTCEFCGVCSGSAEVSHFLAHGTALFINRITHQLTVILQKYRILNRMCTADVEDM
jgi:hypothetical protein